MGLDSYAARSEGDGLTEADVAAFEEAGLELAAGSSAAREARSGARCTAISSGA
jgi:hypothetical protein